MTQILNYATPKERILATREMDTGQSTDWFKWQTKSAGEYIALRGMYSDMAFAEWAEKKS